MNKNKISIIGSGAFACAIYTSLCDVIENDISIFFKDNDCLEYILQNNGEHPKMNCKIKNNTLLTTDLTTAIKERDIIFLCCTFSAVLEVVSQIKQINEKQDKLKIVICCKGMLKDKPFFLYQEIKNQLNNSTVFVLSGGSFADEMCEKKTTLVNLSCEDEKEFHKMSKIFSNFLQVKYCTNPCAIEMLGALKNIMAIYTGYCSKNNSINEVISGMVDFINEIRKVFLQLGFDDKILFEPAGIGDIMLTCLSGKSRNKTFGELLATDDRKASNYKQTTTIEGYNAIFAVQNFCLDKNIKFPLLNKLIDIIKLI